MDRRGLGMLSRTLDFHAPILILRGRRLSDAEPTRSHLLLTFVPGFGRQTRRDLYLESPRGRRNYLIAVLARSMSSTTNAISVRPFFDPKMQMDCTLIPARASRLATFASSPGRSKSSRFRMSLSSYFRPAFVKAFCVVCTSEVTTRRNDASCFDSLAIARMLTAPFDRASVTRANSPVLSAT